MDAAYANVRQSPAMQTLEGMQHRNVSIPSQETVDGSTERQVRTTATVEFDVPEQRRPSAAEADLFRHIHCRLSAARLMLYEEGATREFPLSSTFREIRIGRCPSCDIRLVGDGVSTHHARIVAQGGRITIEDLASRNGLRVNGMSVHKHRLVHGDWIRIDTTRIRFIHPHSNAERTHCRRPVVLIPGLASTELWNGTKKVWPNQLRLATSTARRMQHDWSQLKVGQIERENVVIPGVFSTFLPTVSSVCVCRTGGWPALSALET